MNHIINVSFVNPNDPNRVHADPNPLPDSQSGDTVSPGDTVTWLLDKNTVGDRELQVVFKKFGDFPIDLNSLTPCNPLGPFSSLAIGARLIFGTIRSDVPQDVGHSRRFFYKLIEDGAELTWDNTVGPDLLLGGGIDIPKTPPPPIQPPASPKP